MDERLDAYITHRNEFRELLKAFCANKTIPVNERWEAFIKSDLGDIYENMIVPDGMVKQVGEVAPYDYETAYGWQKRQLVSISDWLEQDFEGNDENEPLIVDTDVFKEYFLTKFIKAFIFDW